MIVKMLEYLARSKRSHSLQQNVAMSLRLHQQLSLEKRITKSVAILEAVGMGNRLDYYPESLSGGQKQRIAIARRSSAFPVRVNQIQFC
jgi:ABC-type methionine transport system ATPase subunit